MEWFHAVEQLQTRVVRIRTPAGSGSGFMLPWQSKAGLLAVATAAHVIDHAHYWEQPIRIDQVHSDKSVLLRDQARAIFLTEARDTAVVVFEQKDFQPDKGDLQFVEPGKHLMVGNEVGWLGFPAIARSLCFFSGRVSAWDEEDKAYLVDAVAVNGVSGGPVFFMHRDAIYAVGVVSAYIPNRTTGESLPGLAIARDVTYLHEQATAFASMDEALAAQSAPSPPPDQPGGEALATNIRSAV